MKIECNHCQQIIEIDDADVIEYAAGKMTKAEAAAIMSSGCSEAKRIAITANSKKPRWYHPRPGSKGNTRAKKKE